MKKILTIAFALCALNFLTDVISAQQAEEKPLTCTVQKADAETQIVPVNCGTFIIDVIIWPKAWEDYKAPGSDVLVKLVEGEPVPIAHSCHDRIVKRFKAQSSAGRPSIDAITPSDCMQIDSHVREAFTKEQP